MGRRGATFEKLSKTQDFEAAQSGDYAILKIVRTGVSDKACSEGRQWMSYPIEIDRSKKRKMDNGLCCKDITEQDISDCMIRHPYSAGQGTWGDNLSLIHI